MKSLIKQISTMAIVFASVLPTVARAQLPQAALEAELLKMYGDYDEIRYFANAIDLNEDGEPEVIVHLVGRVGCGSGGCNTLVFTPEDEGLRLVTKMTVNHPPIIALETRTNGWRDLSVFVGGGGIWPGYNARLQFDGETYPSNPSVSPAQPMTEESPGTVIIEPYDSIDDARFFAPNSIEPTEIRRTQLPPLRQNMPLAEAIVLLSERGWRSISTLPNDRIGRNQFPHCSGTGWGFCNFGFENATRETLNLITFGLDYKLARWFFNDANLSDQTIEANYINIPPLERGMPYEDARTLLLNEGWFSLSFPPTVGFPQNSILNYLASERGFFEVAECHEVEPKTCRFELGSVTGEKLTVTTVNNEIGQEPLVEEWGLDEQ